jgi:5,10-methylenetetrahydrofolate reductase
MVAVELRPPRANLSRDQSIDTWIDMYHGIRGVVKQDAFIFLTDNAVGQDEEESLHHLQTNMAQDVSPSRLVPILTCKHTRDYCLMFADRAASNGYESLTVTGGDKTVGAPRCFPRAYQLREQIRERAPSLTLGGWANPHRDPHDQVGYLMAEDATCEYYLTQVVSHHDMPKVEAYLKAARERGLEVPGIFGVFFYRSARLKTLKMLSNFLPVPVEQVRREFKEEKLAAEEVCARTLRALRDVGVEKVYVSNLDIPRAGRQLKGVLDLL